MIEAYKTETLEQHGKTYRIEWVYDNDSGTPWEQSDGHGIVSDWERRDKAPGELILSDDGRGYKRFYNFAETMKIAKADGWNTSPYNWPSKGAQAHAAVMADYEYLRRWCNDQWHYCGIVVTMLDDNGEETDISESLWGIEDQGYLSSEYHSTVIQDLIRDCEYLENSRIYPVNTMGV